MQLRLCTFSDHYESSLIFQAIIMQFKWLEYELG